MNTQEFLTEKGVWRDVDMVTVGRKQLSDLLDEYAEQHALVYAKPFKDLVHKQSLAIGLIMKHFPKDILSDQMGEDHDTFLKAIK